MLLVSVPLLLFMSTTVVFLFLQRSVQVYERSAHVNLSWSGGVGSTNLFFVRFPTQNLCAQLAQLSAAAVNDISTHLCGGREGGASQGSKVASSIAVFGLRCAL